MVLSYEEVKQIVADIEKAGVNDPAGAQQAKRSVIGQWLRQLEAFGAEPPTLEQIAMLVTPDDEMELEFARMLDRLPEAEQEAAINMLNGLMDVSGQYGADVVNRVIAELVGSQEQFSDDMMDLGGSTKPIDKEFFAEVVGRQIDGETVSQYSQAVNAEAEVDHGDSEVNGDVARQLQSVIQYVQDRYVFDSVVATRNPDGLQVSLTFTIPK